MVRREEPGAIDRSVQAGSAARVAGFGYLVIFALAIFANFFVVSGLVESGDASATAANIVESEGLFRSGLMAFIVVFALDVAVAWALYIFFRGVNREMSLLTAWFRLVYTVMLGVGLVFMFLALQVLDGAGAPGAVEAGSRDGLVMQYMDGFDFAWLVGLFCFGVHLMLLGRLSLKSGFVPRAIGIFLMFAGAAYMLDTTARSLLSNYEDYENAFLVMVAVPSLIGELALALWLLIRGSKRGNDGEKTLPEAERGIATSQPVRSGVEV